MLRRAPLVAAAFGATALFFHRAVFTADVFIFRDVFRVYYPLKQYWAERVGAGGFPQWFPGDGLGQPFVGMLISGAFHPGNLLFLAFSSGAAFKLNVLLCYPTAILGAAALAQRFGASPAASALAGIAYAFCGFLVGLSSNLLYLEAAATVPWVLWATDRLVAEPSLARGWVAGALLALVAFAGDGQMFAVVAAGMGWLAVCRRKGRVLPALAIAGSAAAFGGVVAAVQILPALATLPESGSSAMGREMIMTWSMHPLQFLELALGPLFGGDPATAESIAIARDLLSSDQTSLWVESMHLGFPVLVLAGAGAATLRRDRRFQLALAATGLIAVLMFGKHAGLYGWLIDALPLWKAFRYPLKLTPLFVLALALTAAWGLAAATQTLSVRATVVRVLGGLGALLALGGLTAGAWVRPVWAAAAQGAVLERLTEQTARGLWYSALACLASAVALRFVRSAQAQAAAVAAIAGVHLLAANEPFVMLADPAVLESPPPFARAIAQAERPGDGFRVVDLLEVMPIPELGDASWANRFAAASARAMAADSHTLWGLDGANAYLPATSSRYRALAVDKRLWLPRYSPLFSTRWVVIPNQTYTEIHGSRDAVFAEDRQFGLLLLRNPRALPRAYLAHTRCVTDREAALRALAAASPAAGEAIVECGHDAPAAEGGDPGTVAVTARAPERIELLATATREAAVVLTDAHYGGWSATVDGAPAEIRPANVAGRSVAIPTGTHRVELTYRAPGLAAGAWISGLAAVGGLVAAIAVQRKSRREKMMIASPRNPAV